MEFSSQGIILAPILPPTRLDGIWGSLWCSLVLIELSSAGGLSLTNQAKRGKIQTIMNEYVSVDSELEIFALSDSAYLDKFCFINNSIP